jgi:hypothetical protein
MWTWRKSPFSQGDDPMDFSNMNLSDWIIRAAIFAVLACVVIGTFQNIFSALKARGGKNSRH